MSYTAVIDLIMFGTVFLVIIPLFLVAFNPFVVAATVIYALYIGVLGVICLRKIPRWCRSKKGVKFIFYWMSARVAVFLWTTICYLLIVIHLCLTLANTQDEVFKAQGYFGLVVLLSIGGFLGFQAYSATTLFWAVKQHIYNPSTNKSKNKVNKKQPALLLSTPISISPTARSRKSPKSESDHMLISSGLQSKSHEQGELQSDDSKSHKSMNTVASSNRKLGVKLKPTPTSKNKVHPMIGVTLGDQKQPAIPLNIFDKKKA
jgi:hypothetical protein